jgi:hypothetical protein
MVTGAARAVSISGISGSLSHYRPAVHVTQLLERPERELLDHAASDAGAAAERGRMAVKLALMTPGPVPEGENGAR